MNNGKRLTRKEHELLGKYKKKTGKYFIRKIINEACYKAWDMGHKAPKTINLIDQFFGYAKAERLIKETINKIMLEINK